MAFVYVNNGPGWRLARCLDVLASEITAAYPDATCLGTLGDAAHQAQDFESDHNPFIIDPSTGLGVVRAIDVAGPDATLKLIRQRIWDLYAAQDPRVWAYGYAKGTSDNLINDWGLPFRTHVNLGDAGHLHISVTQRDGLNPSPAGYVSSIDSTAPWGIAAPDGKAANDMSFRVIECPKEPQRAALGIWVVGTATRLYVATPGPTGFEGIFLGLPECLNAPDASGAKYTQQVNAQTWDSYFSLAGDPDPLHPTPTNVGGLTAAGLAQAIVKLLPSNVFPEDQLIEAVSQALSQATFTGTFGVNP